MILGARLSAVRQGEHFLSGLTQQKDLVVLSQI
jgi:hypothetical protein